MRLPPWSGYAALDIDRKILPLRSLVIVDKVGQGSGSSYPLLVPSGPNAQVMKQRLDARRLFNAQGQGCCCAAPAAGGRGVNEDH
jgi:hypothetical protein